MKVMVLDADYFMNGKVPVIRLFCKTEDSSTICVYMDDMYPYFYIKTKSSIEEIPGILEKAARKIQPKPSIKSVSEENKFLPLGFHAEKTKLIKITLYDPQDVAKMRDILLAEGIVESVYEADIMYKYRFMVDHNIHGMQWIDVDGEKTWTSTSKFPVYHGKRIEPLDTHLPEPLKYMSFDIECVSSDERRAPDSKKDKIIMISAAFEPSFKGRKNLVFVAKKISSDGVESFASEKEMLEDFVNAVKSYDPDVLIGYNLNDFDMPWILDRCEKNEVKCDIQRSEKRIIRKKGVFPETIVPGRIVVDPFQILKRDPWQKFVRYDLNTIAKTLLNDKKDDVEYKEISKLWNGNREDVLRLVEYARKDSILALRLVIEKGLLDKFIEVSKISGLLLQDVFGGQTKRIETMMLYEFKKHDFVMPFVNKKFSDGNQNLKGATVLEPEKGLHAEKCTIVLDFKSLYPSIMRTFNISPDTLLLKDFDGPHNISPSGAKFVTEDVRSGILPQMLAKLITARDEAKKEMKSAEGDKKRMLNARQLALKDLSNSMYGFTGYSRARLYMIDVASSITAYGRENIDKTAKVIKEKFNVNVIYGDSITKDRFVTLLNPDGIIEIKNIEELFEQNKKNTVFTPDGKQRIFLKGYKALTVNPFKKQPEWSHVKEIIRHKTNKKIYRVNQKFGETVVTEDHSLMTENNGIIEETKPTQLGLKKLVRVEHVPEVKKINKIDMFELVKNYEHKHEYKGRIKTAKLWCDKKYIWFGWENRKTPIKMVRFIKIESQEFDSLCKLIGAYIAEGSSSTLETTKRYGCSISCSDVEWLKGLQQAYHTLFKNTNSCIVKSSKGIRMLSYGGKKIFYQDKTYKLQMMNSLAAVVFKVLCGQKSDRKKIPGFMFHVPHGKQKIMLENMIKEYKLKNFRYDTKSLQLACCLSILLLMHGKKYTIKFRNGKKIYRITTCTKYNKKTKTTVSNEQYKGYVYDLSVDKNHMFVDACGQILLHNTDSVFIEARTNDLDETKKLGEEIAKYISENLPGYLELQFEKIYKTFLILTKKRYAGWRHDYVGGKWVEKIDMKGIETVRRDWCPLVSEVMREVLDILLKEGDVKKSITLVKGVVQKLKKNEIPLEKLMVVKGITRNINDYKGMQAHVELAKKMHARDPSTAPGIGDRVGFVIVKGNELLSKRAEDPKYVAQNNLQVDADYYIQSQLLPPIERILGSMNVERSELMGSGRQTSLAFASKKRNVILTEIENFVCAKCEKKFRRVPLRGMCDCGGSISMTNNGSVGDKYKSN